MLEPQIIALITGFLAAIGGFCKWAVGIWATVRREHIEAVVLQATSNEKLAGRIDGLSSRLDTLAFRLDTGFESISNVSNILHTPPPEREPLLRPEPPPARVPRERISTQPTGHQIREPRRGTHHDAED